MRMTKTHHELINYEIPAIGASNTINYEIHAIGASYTIHSTYLSNMNTDMWLGMWLSKVRYFYMGPENRGHRAAHIVGLYIPWDSYS